MNVAGKLYPNETWSGCIGQLIRNEADLSFAPFYFTPKRYKVVEFSPSIVFHPIQFIVRRGEKGFNWNSIFKPFTLELWLGMLTSIIIFGFTLYHIIKFSYYLKHIGRVWTFTEVYWFICGSFVNQGGNLDSVKRFSSRLSIGIWLMVMVALASGYASTLISFLTYHLYERIPTTFDELATEIKSGKYTCGTVKSGSRYILNSKSESGKIIGEYIRSTKFLLDKNEINKLLQNKGFAFIQSRHLLRKLIDEYRMENVLISKDVLFTYSSSYVMRKEFPLKDKIHETVSRLFEAGIINEVEKLTENDNVKVDSEIRPLSIEDFSSVLILLLFGYAVSFLCFGIELLTRKISDMARNRSSEIIPLKSI
ncbi:glutamate receptor-like [Centruroides sculpturatus]|uniref:glutamate receptor-like n=1 Tax=Centruroides sculpturatus TaxID=218467 RepID=UPI000C6DB732|nr:glutamate receptor-like [Centruroides sculpturatus]XP_023221420.1 glutamate receptor-like [Centruroides sculpturatus]XP_023221421.1 glutamate receptor-like [Centruroides sculpturatus]XP_023221423.1 glutamate receptor-like [Centruroides sculpturatus]XP_023221424.1 glutamate receptor-like [Centruroides sculpturatus]XP_023221425.1 glutamate receptor-like [Centruroides sculpturatus]XP_023221426.1 glutamate receptor-like [Centruroides sculpturatus]XP_023221427.1 glutamate receptor-like [Centru